MFIKSSQCRFFSVVAVFFIVISSSAVSAERTLRFNYSEDANGRYAVGLLKNALQRDTDFWKYESLDGEISQARMIELVRSEKLDVMWAATNKKMEKTLLPVRIPLYKGLLGHRIFIIHKNNQSRFDAIREKDDFKNISMGQGTTWADTGILLSNGFNVIKANKYESLFYMVDGGRFDAFPRGVQEPWNEISSRPELELTVEKNLMLIYRMPFYLFVSKNNALLAQKLESGLREMIADGSFHDYFINDPTVQDVVEKSNLKNRLSFPLDNPTLPKETPINEAQLWLDPTQL